MMVVGMRFRNVGCGICGDLLVFMKATRLVLMTLHPYLFLRYKVFEY